MLATPYLSVEIDEAQRVRLEQLFQGAADAFAKAMAKALNRGLSVMLREMSRRASHETGIPEKIIRERIWGKRASSRTSGEWVRARGGKIGWPLGRFPYKELLGDAVLAGGGVDVQLGGRALSLPHAFVAQMGGEGGHVGIFERVGKSRLPIYEKRTDAVTDAILRAAGEPDIAKAGATAAVATLQKEADAFLAGKGAAA